MPRELGRITKILRTIAQYVFVRRLILLKQRLGNSMKNRPAEGELSHIEECDCEECFKENQAGKREENFILLEKDRAFVAAALRYYSKRMRSICDDVSSVSGSTGGSLLQISRRADDLSYEINPGTYSDGFITGLKFSS
jgi:hypothetical protein